MKNEDIKKRIDDVMKTDATVASEADFMITHMPFKRLANYKRSEARTTGHNLLKEDDYIQENRFDEKSVFNDFIKEEDRHEFYMIIGRNGSGKSHFIRWMYFQILKHNRENNNEKEKVIFISRAHNNLKDALKTILDSDVLSEERVQYYMSRIGGGVSNASEEELKDIIVSNLRISAKYAETKGILDQISYKKLLCFLEDKTIEDSLLRKEDGPVDRIYCSLTKSEKKGSGDPFEESMFILSRSDINELKRSNDKQSIGIIKFVNDLSRDKKLRSNVVKFLSALETTIIERTASISGADVRSIFEEIRKELYTEGKKLTLLIEDINVYKGIDSALVEVLIQEHNDTNGLCRLKSIVGSTDRYFDDYFNGALYQRMTRKIVILEKTLLEDKSKLVEFAARYINAIHFTKEEIAEWYRGDREFPIWKNNYEFAKVKVDGKDYSIFPFNENAIYNLFECLSSDSRSPREFLKSVIKPGQQLWLDYGKNMINKRSYFTENEGISRINGFISEEDKDRFDGMKYKDFERRELLFLLWGDRTFKTDGNGTVITCIDKEVFEVFGVDFLGKVGEDKKEITKPETILEVVPSKNQVDESYKRTIKYILDWQDGTAKELNPHKMARQYLSEFILKNIDWENEDIPYSFAKQYISSLQNYTIEGSGEEDDTKIFVKRNALSAGMLRALFDQKQNNAKNAWAFGENDYQNGVKAQIIAKTWLLLNRDEIISKTKKAIFVDEEIRQWVIEARICDLIVRGKIDDCSTEDIYEALFNRKKSNDKIVSKNGYKWKELQGFFEKNTEIIRAVFDAFYVNTIGITIPDSKKVEYKIIDSVEIMERIVVARQNIAFGRRKSKLKSSDDRIGIVSQAVVLFSEKINGCVQEDVSFAKKQLNLFSEWLGTGPNEAVIKRTVKSMGEYLYTMRKMNQMSPVNMLETIEQTDSEKEIMDMIKTLQLVVNVKEDFELFVICGGLNNSRIAEVSQVFSRFEKFMNERTEIFKSKIDTDLDRKITVMQNEILSIIDNCTKEEGGEC